MKVPNDYSLLRVLCNNKKAQIHENTNNEENQNPNKNRTKLL
jgi:hypothetical protein